MDDVKLIANFENVADIETFEPFPVHCLPPTFQSFVGNAAKVLQVDECFVALPLIALTSSCIGNRARLQINGSWQVPAILWCCLIGKSGCGKSPAIRCVRALVQSIRDEWFTDFEEAEQEYRDALVKHQRQKKFEQGVTPEKPVRKRLFTNDSTIEALAKLLQSNPNGLLLDMDELADFFVDRYAKGQSQQWLQLHNGDELSHDRKVSESLFVRNPFLSIIGGIQTALVHDIFTTKQKKSGMAARFLFAMPPARKRKFCREEIPAGVKTKMESVLQSILTSDPGPAVISADEDAQALFESYYNDTQAKLADADDDVNAALSKLVEVPLRLALVLLFGEFPNAISCGHSIDGPTMQNAIELAEWFAHEAKRVYASSNHSPEYKLMSIVFEAIEAKSPKLLSVRDLMRSRNRLNKLNADIVERACIALVRIGKIESKTSGKSTVYGLVSQSRQSGR